MKHTFSSLLAPIVALALAFGFISCGAGSNDGPKSISVASISLDKASMPLDVGESENLVATILPADATNKNVSWSSSNPSVASVSGTGLSATVTAVSAGPATITVTTADGSKTATCDVTVPVPDPYDTEFALIKALEEFFPKIQGRNLTEQEQARYSDELKEVFVKAYARDSYSKNLPFSSEEIRRGLAATKYSFPYQDKTYL
jgi:transglutaminase/protease-like cytokinesis protein 3